MLRRLPIVIPALYLFLVVLSSIPIFSGDDPLSGIFAVLLSEPWNALLNNLLSLPGNLTTGLILVFVGAVINAAILYVVLRWLVGRIISSGRATAP